MRAGSKPFPASGLAADRAAATLGGGVRSGAGTTIVCVWDAPIQPVARATGRATAAPKAAQARATIETRRTGPDASVARPADIVIYPSFPVKTAGYAEPPTTRSDPGSSAPPGTLSITP